MNEYFFHEHATSKQMDYAWEHGWRHFGPYFFRYSKMQEKYVLPLRIRLEHFKLSQSQKRVLKKNGNLRVEWLSAFIDEEIEDLFERHKQRFKENAPDSIYTFMSREPATLPCMCQSLCLFYGQTLIAISYLDIGEQACSSVYQCFDLAYEKRSLGMLMMLLSVQRAINLGKHFYYPGYAFQESSHYDYKKTFHALESYDWQVGWRPYPRLLR
jgi:leucyl-tRNA---protein transferase